MLNHHTVTFCFCTHGSFSSWPPRLLRSWDKHTVSSLLCEGSLTLQEKNVSIPFFSSFFCLYCILNYTFNLSFTSPFSYSDLISYFTACPRSPSSWFYFFCAAVTGLCTDRVWWELKKARARVSFRNRNTWCMNYIQPFPCPRSTACNTGS